MYVPDHFRNDNPAELRRLMGEYNFATLVTTATGRGPVRNALAVAR